MLKIGLMYAGCSDVTSSLRRCKNAIQDEKTAAEKVASAASALSGYGEASQISSLANTIKNKNNEDEGKVSTFDSLFKSYVDKLKSNDTTIYNQRG